MTYLEFLERLYPYAEEDFAAFQQRLIFTERKIMGIRTPTLRKLAKEIQVEFQTLFSYPNEYYEVVFLKLTVLSSLPYEQFVSYLREGISLMDNWALCDSFKAKCIKKYKDAFLEVLNELFQTGKEYFVRYVLVTLLSEYMDKKYLPIIRDYLARTDCKHYYVHMAAAWLTAEVLIKYYEEGISLLQAGILPVKTHDKAIQKAVESYRLTAKQKERLCSLKIKQRKR